VKPLNKEISERQEKEIAKETGGVLIPLSGGLKNATASWKGDVNTPLEKFECKVTRKDKYTVRFKDLVKLRSHAANHNRKGVFLFEFIEGPYADKYVCLYEDNNESINEAKGITFYAKTLFEAQKDKECVFKFKYRDTYSPKGISVYSFMNVMKCTYML
jgi:hypothetical protein